MKEPFVPTSTICQMLPYAARREFFRRITPPRAVPPFVKGWQTWPKNNGQPVAGTAVEVIAPWHD